MRKKRGYEGTSLKKKKKKMNNRESDRDLKYIKKQKVRFFFFWFQT